jgi:histidyl-tRNA synthetase
MRDFLPDELAKRNYVIKTIEQVYEKYGFVRLETPSLENLTTLLGKYGDEGDQLLFKILHRRDKLYRALDKPDISEKDLTDMGLRYDLTVPLARVIAHYPELPKFFKRYQLQPVWRADRPGKGRYREFMQCDVDIVGTESLLAEADVCSAVAEVFTAFGFDSFKIHINHRQLLKCLIKAAGISQEKEATTLVAVDKLDKIGVDGVKKELSQRSINSGQADKLLDLICRPEDNDESNEIERLRKALINIEGAQQHIEELQQLCSLLNKTTASQKYCIDASLARGLGYYTGPIFEIRSPKISGSIGGGGRYDGLIGIFKGNHIPAVGFSIGFERLILVLEEQGHFAQLSAGPDVMICHFKDVDDATVLELASYFRNYQIKTEIFPETPKLGKQISYAESANARWVAIIGASEAEEKKVTIKHLSSKNQKTLSWQDAAKLIKN